MFYRDSLYNPNTMKHNFHGDGAINKINGRWHFTSEQSKT